MVAINLSLTLAFLAIITTITAAPITNHPRGWTKPTKEVATEGYQQITNDDNNQYKAPPPPKSSEDNIAGHNDHPTGENLARPEGPPPETKKDKKGQQSKQGQGQAK